MRVMRILVLFDLPTGSASERKSYAEFRKFLLEDGYVMEQFSVYTRVTLNRNNMETHIARLKEHLPDAGDVTVMTMTEAQYMDRRVLRRSPSVQNNSFDPGEQLTLSF